MEKKIYVIRHCEAEGQHSEASLTRKGVHQAVALAEFFGDVKVERIISSPFLRAVQSVELLAEQKNIKLEMDDRLSERVLSTKVLSDWLEKLRATFDDLELKFENGESSQEAMNRGVEVVEGILKSEAKNILMVTHGNLMSLLLKNYQHDFGFEQWRNLSNPDVYLLRIGNDVVKLKRLWG